MGQKTLKQRIARAQFCLAKAVRDQRELDARQQQRRLRKLLKKKQAEETAYAMV